MNGSDDSWVHHGMINHAGNEVWKCEDCQEVIRDFEELMKGRELAKIINSDT